jgi:ubiquinone/menaquinone biosynthesis C-methylase UbiE
MKYLHWALALLPLAIAAPTQAQDHGSTHEHHRSEHKADEHDRGDHATATHRFDDVERWVKRFDDPARSEWQKPEEVARALGIAEGSVIADLGAGTGYFLEHWSKATGPSGTVIAMDVEPNLVTHMRERAEKGGLANVVPVLGSYDNPRLPRGKVDLIVIVDTYHHIGGRIEYFTRVRELLAPAGRLVVIDFKDGDLPVGPPPSHKVPESRVRTELEQAGFTLTSTLDFLPYQFGLVYTVAPSK